jgi:hypothetical protein
LQQHLKLWLIKKNGVKSALKKMGSSLPLTLNNFEQGSTVDLTPFLLNNFEQGSTVDLTPFLLTEKHLVAAQVTLNVRYRYERN